MLESVISKMGINSLGKKIKAIQPNPTSNAETEWFKRFFNNSNNIITEDISCEIIEPKQLPPAKD